MLRDLFSKPLPAMVPEPPMPDVVVPMAVALFVLVALWTIILSDACDPAARQTEKQKADKRASLKPGAARAARNGSPMKRMVTRSKTE